MNTEFENVKLVRDMVKGYNYILFTRFDIENSKELFMFAQNILWCKSMCVFLVTFSYWDEKYL